MGTVQGVYRQPPCPTNYRRPPPLLNGRTTTADSSWRGSKSASPMPTAIQYTPIASRPHIRLHPTSNDADHLSYMLSDIHQKKSVDLYIMRTPNFTNMSRLLLCTSTRSNCLDKQCGRPQRVMASSASWPTMTVQQKLKCDTITTPA